MLSHFRVFQLVVYLTLAVPVHYFRLSLQPIMHCNLWRPEQLPPTWDWPGCPAWSYTGLPVFLSIGNLARADPS